MVHANFETKTLHVLLVFCVNIYAEIKSRQKEKPKTTTKNNSVRFARDNEKKESTYKNWFEANEFC